MDKYEREALNRALYRRCKAVFRHVHVKNPGEKQIQRKKINIDDGKPWNQIVEWGESYAVCCPFCNDTRFRCLINHLYGTDDPNNGHPQTRLVKCYNAGCPLEQKNRDTYAKLYDMLCGMRLVDLRKAEIREGHAVDLTKTRTNWPGRVTRIDKLPSIHPANRYLLGRNFDPEILGQFWNVHWCEHSDHFLCHERLIIPIYHDKQMVGWQARPAFDVKDWKLAQFPKYYTAPGTPRRQILYNCGNASRYRVGIIVEGVTDVWRIGPQAVATLGASFTSLQQKLFAAKFREYAGVLMYDADMRDKLKDSFETISRVMSPQLKSGFCVVQLPQGTDPCSFEREFVRQYIVRAAKPHGVNVDWNRRQ